MKANGKQPKAKQSKAVFLDRDGTIIRQVELLHKISELRLLPRAAQAIRAINRLGYLAIIITNQPVVARGLIEPEGVDSIHAVLIKRLSKCGAKIDAVYFCPHHPNANVKKYRLHCRCRKPNIGMILKAVKKFNINIKKSFLIGDSTRDILAGDRAGLKTILVKTGHTRKDPWQFNARPDFITKNLNEVVKLLKKSF